MASVCSKIALLPHPDKFAHGPQRSPDHYRPMARRQPGRARPPGGADPQSRCAGGGRRVVRPALRAGGAVRAGPRLDADRAVCDEPPGGRQRRAAGRPPPQPRHRVAARRRRSRIDWLHHDDAGPARHAAGRSALHRNGRRDGRLPHRRAFRRNRVPHLFRLDAGPRLRASGRAHRTLAPAARSGRPHRRTPSHPGRIVGHRLVRRACDRFPAQYPCRPPVAAASRLPAAAPAIRGTGTLSRAGACAGHSAAAARHQCRGGGGGASDARALARHPAPRLLFPGRGRACPQPDRRGHHAHPPRLFRPDRRGRSLGRARADGIAPIRAI